MSSTVTIFGKKYPGNITKYNPRYPELEYMDAHNSVKLKYILPDFFKTQKHFSNEEYYAEVIKEHPEYKNEPGLTEKQIQEIIIQKNDHASIEGATSAPAFEKKYGVKMAADYNYPDNMSDIEFSVYFFQKTLGGFFTYKHLTTNVENKNDAYVKAWCDLHYPKNEILNRLQSLYCEIIELNPDLKNYKFDINDPRKLTFFLAGISYRFPIADIMNYIKYDGNVYGNDVYYKEKIKQFEKYGIKIADISRLLSDETIADLIKQIQNNKVKSDTFDKGSNKIKSMFKRLTNFMNLSRNEKN